MAKPKRTRDAEKPAATTTTSAHLAAGWIGAALFALTFALYLPSLGHGFIELYDDNIYVTANPQVLEGLHLKNVYWAFTTLANANWHPVTMLSHMLDVQLFGVDPRWHHFTNLLFHSAATALLFLLLMRLTGARWPSALVAALFAVHPMHVESVAWIAERKDVLSAFFWFLATLLYVRYTEQPSLRRYVPMAICFVLGLLSKPMLVTLPCTLLLLDYWPLRRATVEKLSDLFSPANLKLLVEKIPLFVLTLIAAIATVVAQAASGAVADTASLPILVRLANAAVAYATYVVKTIWIADYAVIYPHTKSFPPLWQLLGALLLLGAVTALALWQARPRPHLLVGWLWFLGTLVPVIGIVQVGFQSMADRYHYIPSIGLFIIFAWGIVLPLGRLLGKPVAITCAVMVLLSMTLAMRLQLGYWRDDEALFRRAVEVTENNFTASYNLGAALMRQGRFDEAEPHLAEAARLDPENRQSRQALANALYAQRKLGPALERFREVEALEPGLGVPSHTMGMILETLGRPDEAAEMFKRAEADFRALIQKKADDPAAHLNLGMLLNHLGRKEEARDHFREVLRLKPEMLSPEERALAEGAPPA